MYFLQYSCPFLIYELLSAVCYSSGELLKLEEDGYLIYVNRDCLEKDKLFPKTKCFSAIVKLDMRILNGAFFSMTNNTECNEALYKTNYNKEIDKVMKQVATTYISDIMKVNFSLPSEVSDCKCKKSLNEICYIIIIYMYILLTLLCVFVFINCSNCI